MSAGPEQTAAVWCDSERAALVRDVLGRMPAVRVLAVGGPTRGAVSDLADALDAPAVDDLRKMLVDHRPQSLLLCCGEAVNRKDLREARAAGTHIIAVEPPDAELDTAGNGTTEPPGVMIAAPWFRIAPAWSAAADPEQVIGRTQSLAISVVGPPGAGSLFARLYDALEMVSHLLGLPDNILAALTGPLIETPDDLRALTGHLSAMLRYADGRAALVLASDRAATFRRRLHALGTGGQLVLEDDRYTLHGPDGALIDSHETERSPAAPDPAEMIAAQWRRVLEGGKFPRPADGRAIVALAHAAMLSCRTGESESTETMLRITTG